MYRPKFDDHSLGHVGDVHESILGSGSVSGTLMSGVGARYSEPGNYGSSGAGRARRFSSCGGDVSVAAESDCPTVSVFAY